MRAFISTIIFFAIPISATAGSFGEDQVNAVRSRQNIVTDDPFRGNGVHSAVPIGGGNYMTNDGPIINRGNGYYEAPGNQFYDTRPGGKAGGFFQDLE